MLGGSTSGSVAAASKALTQAGLVHISPSATRTTLDEGPNASEATQRVLPRRPRATTPGPDGRAVHDQQAQGEEGRDRRLPGAVLAWSRGRGREDPQGAGVRPSRLSVGEHVTDFSSLVTRVPNDADIVFFPTQQPGDAQTFGQQLLEQGKKAKVFGGDGTNGPAAFKLPGRTSPTSRRTSRASRRDKARDRRLEEGQPEGKALGSFGPPTYVAVEVMLIAIRKACDAGNGSIANRAAVLKYVKKVDIPKWILGGTFRVREGEQRPAERRSSTSSRSSRTARTSSSASRRATMSRPGATGARAARRRRCRLGAAPWTPSSS